MVISSVTKQSFLEIRIIGMMSVIVAFPHRILPISYRGRFFSAKERFPTYRKKVFSTKERFPAYRKKVFSTKGRISANEEKLSPDELTQLPSVR